MFRFDKFSLKESSTSGLICAKILAEGTISIFHIYAVAGQSRTSRFPHSEIENPAANCRRFG